MRSLLDVNVLIAALDAAHVHHERVSAWLRSEAARGWASTPLTQNGCVRVMCQPAYPNPLRPVDVVSRLREATTHPSHEFWPDDLSVLDSNRIRPERLLGPRQVTDVYLLALAVTRGGRLVTLDSRIPLEAAVGAKPTHLLVL